MKVDQNPRKILAAMFFSTVLTEKCYLSWFIRAGFE